MRQYIIRQCIIDNWYTLNKYRNVCLEAFNKHLMSSPAVVDLKMRKRTKEQNFYILS